MEVNSGEGASSERGQEKRDCLSLIGFMGAGKSAVGEALGAVLGMESVDLDDVITLEAGMSIEEIFAGEGEEGFRERESDALAAQLREGRKVISCGGGIVLRPANVDILRRRCLVFLLEVSLDTAVRRLGSGAGRPLLRGGDPEAEAARLMRERENLYRKAAHVIVKADDRSPNELAEEIAERWRKYWSGPGEGNTRYT